MSELIMNVLVQFGILYPIVVICSYAVHKYYVDKDLVKKLTNDPSTSIILIACLVVVTIANIWLSIAGSTETPILVKSWVDFIIYSLFMTGLPGFAMGISRMNELPEKVTGIVSDVLSLISAILLIPLSVDLVSFLRDVL